MNDELVYALLGLIAHWWVGVQGAKAMIRYDAKEWDVLEMQLILCGMVFVAGSLVAFLTFMSYWVIPRINAWYDAGGRIFRDKDGD